MTRRLSLAVALAAVTFVTFLSFAISTTTAPLSSMSPIPGTGTLGAAPSDTFSFIVAGDNRPASAADSQPKTPKHIFDSAAARHVAFVVWTGDMIYGLDSTNPSALAAQYKGFFKLAKRATVPVFAAPGNHEMDVKHKLGDTTIEVGNATMQQYYRKAFALADSTPIYGTFTYGNSRFILLNSEEIPAPSVSRAAFATASATVKLDPGYVSAQQLAWLGQVLDSNTSLHTFVFMHHPLHALKADMALDTASAAKVLALLGKHANISYVLASHEHLYYNVQTRDTTSPPGRTDPSTSPPYYLISGGAGAKLTGKPKDGGFHNYLTFTVRGTQVQATLNRLP
ncbi:MAG TPA: metallophosphoesterase [Gemmatimonadaceae bacterium]|nr:metallophosphoesterase [Gemmatimonadaceae bacterium]